MDMRVLEYFLMVAEEGNITRAAKLLHVSQPTVSRQLMELEAEVGKTLFVRRKRNITLTKQGVLFRETAREILTLYEKAVKEDAAQEILTGDIYIGTVETRSFEWLAEKLGQFQEMHPAVKFHIVSENADRISEDIEKGLLDLGFVHRQPNSMKLDYLNLPFEEHWGVLLPHEHPLASKTTLTAQDLEKEKLILPENAVFQREIMHWLGLGTEHRIVGFFNLIHNAIIMTRQEVGLTVCFGREKQFGDELRFVPFDGIEAAGSYLIWKKLPVQMTVMERFLEYLSNTVIVQSVK